MRQKLLIVGYITLLITIPITFYLFKDQIRSSFLKPKVSIQPKLIRETTIAEVAAKSHPSLFYADLEYDPNTEAVALRETSVGRGDPPSLFPDKPPDDNNRLSFKVEVVSKENIVLQSGWYSDYKQKVKPKEGLLRFSVVTGYEPGAIVKLYYPNESKLIWLGKIQ
ncbi:MAG: hypothetical protein AAB414_00360 [Patescibacteria group bacterium]